MSIVDEGRNMGLSGFALYEMTRIGKLTDVDHRGHLWRLDPLGKGVLIMISDMNCIPVPRTCKVQLFVALIFSGVQLKMPFMSAHVM